MFYGREITLDDVEIGSRVAVSIGGENFVLTIESLEEDVKNDRPGGEGSTDDGDGRWFYLEQITRVIRKAPLPTVTLKVEASAPAVEHFTEVAEKVAEVAAEEIITTQGARRAIVDGLLAAAKTARTTASQEALKEAAALVSMDEHAAARKILVPLRTRQARAAIAAIKAL
jgi:hypothetical protein